MGPLVVVPGSSLQRLTKISTVQEILGTIAIYERHFAVLLAALGASMEKQPRNKRWEFTTCRSDPVGPLIHGAAIPWVGVSLLDSQGGTRTLIRSSTIRRRKAQRTSMISEREDLRLPEYN
jgi:hypothetical protein